MLQDPNRKKPEITTTARSKRWSTPWLAGHSQINRPRGTGYRERWRRQRMNIRDQELSAGCNDQLLPELQSGWCYSRNRKGLSATHFRYDSDTPLTRIRVVLRNLSGWRGTGRTYQDTRCAYHNHCVTVSLWYCFMYATRTDESTSTGSDRLPLYINLMQHEADSGEFWNLCQIAEWLGTIPWFLLEANLQRVRNNGLARQSTPWKYLRRPNSTVREVVSTTAWFTSLFTSFIKNITKRRVNHWFCTDSQYLE